MQTERDEWEPEADWLLFPFEEHWKPHRPYAGKAKSGGYYRTSRERALTLPYFEANPRALTSLIITDHDGGRADEIAALAGLPVPSYIATNPFTNDGHIVYALKGAVVLTDCARRGPVNLLARVEAGLNDVLAGDVAYGGRFTKNPRHTDHLTLFGPEYATYDLKELAGPLEALGALPKWSTSTERRKKLHSSGTGRNVDLFDLVRRWSYRRVRDYSSHGLWFPVVHDHAWDRNMDIIGQAYDKGPMEPGEVRQVAHSISRWTFKHITRTFSEEQARRGQRGGTVSAAKLADDERVERARAGGVVGGRATSQAKREAIRRNATKYDMDAIVRSAMEA
jgi:Replicase family/Primase C terminal 1 (PriCT-1)